MESTHIFQKILLRAAVFQSPQLCACRCDCRSHVNCIFCGIEIHCSETVVAATVYSFWSQVQIRWKLHRIDSIPFLNLSEKKNQWKNIFVISIRFVLVYIDISRVIYGKKCISLTFYFGASSSNSTIYFNTFSSFKVSSFNVALRSSKSDDLSFIYAVKKLIFMHTFSDNSA